MLIFKCDRCGKEQKHYSIVEDHLKFSNTFRTLTHAYRYDLEGRRVTDVCLPCFDVVGDAIIASKIDRAKKEHRTFLQIILGTGKV